VDGLQKWFKEGVFIKLKLR